MYNFSLTIYEVNNLIELVNTKGLSTNDKTKQIEYFTPFVPHNVQQNLQAYIMCHEYKTLVNNMCHIIESLYSNGILKKKTITDNCIEDNVEYTPEITITQENINNEKDNCITLINNLRIIMGSLYSNKMLENKSDNHNTQSIITDTDTSNIDIDSSIISLHPVSLADDIDKYIPMTVTPPSSPIYSSKQSNDIKIEKRSPFIPFKKRLPSLMVMSSNKTDDILSNSHHHFIPFKKRLSSRVIVQKSSNQDNIDKSTIELSKQIEIIVIDDDDDDNSNKELTKKIEQQRRSKRRLNSKMIKTPFLSPSFNVIKKKRKTIKKTNSEIRFNNNNAYTIVKVTQNGKNPGKTGYLIDHYIENDLCNKETLTWIIEDINDPKLTWEEEQCNIYLM